METKEVIIYGNANELEQFVVKLIEQHQQKLAPAAPITLEKPDYLKAKQVHKMLNISPFTCRKYVSEGLLKNYRLGGRLYFREDEVRASVERIASNKYKKNLPN